MSTPSPSKKNENKIEFQGQQNEQQNQNISNHSFSNAEGGNTVDSLVKQLGSNNPLEAIKQIQEIAASRSLSIQQHLKNIVTTCSAILQGTSLQSDLKIALFTLYETLLNNYAEETELILGNQIYIILLNLGDEQPSIRKKSHVLLLKYIRCYGNSEILLKVFLSSGFTNPNWIVRQKSINSLHSIVVSDSHLINWNSSDMLDLTELSIQALYDDNSHVQKASEQFVIYLTKTEQFQAITKKLSRESGEKLKKFIEAQQLLGSVQPFYSLEPLSSQNSVQLPKNATLPLNQQSKLAESEQNNVHSQINMLKQSNAPSYSQKLVTLGSNIIKEKYQSSTINDNTHISPNQNLAFKSLYVNKQSTENIKDNPNMLYGFMTTQLHQNLLDENDWRARTAAIEEINSQMNNIYDFPLIFERLKDFLTILIKLSDDANFKISMTALQIITKLSKHESFNQHPVLDVVIPTLISKLAESKVAIRSQTIKIMREHIKIFGQYKWLDVCLTGLRNKNSNAKEEILSLVTQLYDELTSIAEYNWEKILREVAPLLEDQKTKIKIKSVDCLVAVSIRTNKEQCKKQLQTLLNKVYYEMYLEKLEQKLFDRHSADIQFGSEWNSVYSNSRTNESFRVRENDLNFNFVDSAGNLMSNGFGSNNQNFGSSSNQFRPTIQSAKTPEEISGSFSKQSSLSQSSTYNPFLGSSIQSTNYSNSQLGYTFDRSNPNIDGGNISPLISHNRPSNQDCMDISLFSQSQMTGHGHFSRSNQGPREVNSQSVYSDINMEKQTQSSSSRRAQNPGYLSSNVTESSRTPDSRFSQWTNNQTSSSSNTIFLGISQTGVKKSSVNSVFRHGLQEVSTSSSSRSAVISGDNNLTASVADPIQSSGKYLPQPLIQEEQVKQVRKNQGVDNKSQRNVTDNSISPVRNKTIQSTYDDEPSLPQSANEKDKKRQSNSYKNEEIIGEQVKQEEKREQKNIENQNEMSEQSNNLVLVQKSGQQLSYCTQKGLDEFTISTFDKQIKENYCPGQSSSNSNSSQNSNNTLPVQRTNATNSSSQNKQSGRIAVKNKEFNVPLNLYKGVNSTEDAEEKGGSSYQFKPYIIKKAKRFSSDQMGLGEQQTSSLANQQLQGNSETVGVTANSANLVIESKEYHFKNNPNPTIEDSSEQSQMMMPKHPLRPLKKTLATETSEQQYEEEEEEEKRSLKPNLKITKKKMIAKMPTPIEIVSQPNVYVSALDSKKQVYLSKEELDPLSDPKSAFKGLLNELKVDDWSRQFDGLNTLRRISHHHSELLSNQNILHNLMTEVLSLVENLRSSLAKNAMIALSEISEKMKRGLDTECDAIMSRLLKKGCDSNSFITEEVMQVILSKYQNRILNFKLNISLIMRTLIDKNGNKCLSLKDFDKILLVLSSYITDSAHEVRTHAKQTFSLLLNASTNKSDIDKTLQRVLPDAQYSKIKNLF